MFIDMVLLLAGGGLAGLAAVIYTFAVARNVATIRAALAEAAEFRPEIIHGLLTLRLTWPARRWLTHQLGPNVQAQGLEP